MFTGIIEELGRIRSIEKRGEDARIVIEARMVTEGSRDGDSISVNGVCLTALDVKPDSFAADVSKETLFRSIHAMAQRDVMKLFGFTFKNEAKWMVIFSLAMPAIGLLVLLITFILSRF